MNQRTNEFFPKETRQDAKKRMENEKKPTTQLTEWISRDTLYSACGSKIQAAKYLHVWLDIAFLFISHVRHWFFFTSLFFGIRACSSEWNDTVELLMKSSINPFNFAENFANSGIEVFFKYTSMIIRLRLRILGDFFLILSVLMAFQPNFRLVCWSPKSRFCFFILAVKHNLMTT